MMNLDISGKLKAYTSKLPLNLKRALLFPFKGAMKFLTLYFFGIGFFSLIYTFHPEDFHHYTSHLEPEIKLDKQKLLNQIASDVTNETLHQYPSFDKFKISIKFENDKIDSLRIFIIEKSTKISAYYSKKALLSAPKQKQKKLHHSQKLGLVAHLKPNVFITFIGDATLDNWLEYLPKCKSHEENLIRYFNEALKADKKLYLCNSINRDLKLGFKLSNKTLKRYNDLNQALNGKGQYASGNHWRMLYFSVTTMTTLGYGDIVPLTNKMRAVVAFQTIFGIILLGAFLNSLTSSRKN